MGGTGYDSGNNIAIDSSKNIFTTGSFEGTADFDPSAGTANLTSAGAYNIFVSKLEHDAVGPCSPAIVVANNQNAGAGSLRQGILDVCSEGTITFDPSLSGETIYLASTLTIDKSVTIDGSSLVSHIRISGDTDNNGTGDVSVFQIGGPATVELNGLDIVKGKSSGASSGGGGIANYGILTIKNSIVSGNSYVGGIGGGGIYNKGELSIIDSTVTGNSAEDGGGIFNEFNHTLTVTGSTFSNNTAQSTSEFRGGAGAIVNIGTLSLEDSIFLDNYADKWGGAIVNSIDGTVTVSNSSFTNNSAIINGGAINNFDGSMMIENCIFTGNSVVGGSESHGGAVHNEDETSITNSIFTGNSGFHGGGIANFNTVVTGATLTIANSTFADNSADYGGGIVNLGLLTVTNNTFFNNSADEYGGGILNTGTLILTNSTISGNSGLTGGGGIANLGTLNYANTIIANSTSGEECYSFNGSIGMNINNLVENYVVSPNQCGTPNLTADPNLGPLANNGGSTLTMSLLPGSPAIDAGDDSICAAMPVNNTSQNGVTRPQGAHCDIGSFEYIDAIAPTVSSIVRANTNPTAAISVDFTVTFSESVTDVNAADFVLNTSGVAGASLTGVSGSGTTYNVKVNTGSGNGIIRLNVPVGVTITDLAGNTIANLPFTSGQFYTVNRSVPKAPILRSPRTNTITNNPLPTFWWTNVAGGQTYEIVFAMDSAFANIVDSEIVVGSPYIGVLPLNDGKYFWRVRAYSGSNQPGAWSSYRMLTIDTTAPPIPVLSSPANNSSTRRVPIFKWQKANTAIAYQFQYDNNSDFSSPIYTIATRGNFRRPPAMRTGTYYWRVRAKDTAGNWSDWSTFSTINITIP